MANRTSSTELNILQQNGVSHNFFYGGKSGVKFKKLGASSFFCSLRALFWIQLHYSQQQISQDVEVVIR